MESLADIAMPALWGFLVGFVGWGGCFRLVEPISTWLIDASHEHYGVTFTRVVVMIFLVAATVLALALVPLVVTSTRSVEAAGSEWKPLFGVVFVASLAGLFALGAVRRLVGSRPRA